MSVEHNMYLQQDSLRLLSAVRDTPMTSRELWTHHFPSRALHAVNASCRRLARSGLVSEDDDGCYSLTDEGRKYATLDVQPVQYTACHAVERFQERLHIRCVHPDGPPTTLCGRQVRMRPVGSSKDGLERLGRPRDLPHIKPIAWGADSDWCEECVQSAQRAGLIPGREAMEETE